MQDRTHFNESGSNTHDSTNATTVVNPYKAKPTTFNSSLDDANNYINNKDRKNVNTLSDVKSSSAADEHKELLHDSERHPREGELIAAQIGNAVLAVDGNYAHNPHETAAALEQDHLNLEVGDEEVTDDSAMIDEVSQEKKRHLMTPGVVLFLMCALNFLIYFDRGAVNGALLAIQDDRKISPHGKLSDSRGGMIGSVFMFGYMFTCPLFSALNGLIKTKYIILLGMFVWCVSCVGVGLCVSYGTLLAARTFVGVGEAAIVGVTVTIIDNIAPLRWRTLWIGVFFAMMPLATAVGMYVGNVVGGYDNLFNSWIAAWRATFVLEACVCVPVLVCVGFLPDRYDIRVHALLLQSLKRAEKKKEKDKLKKEKNEKDRLNNNNNNNNNNTVKANTLSAEQTTSANVRNVKHEGVNNVHENEETENEHNNMDSREQRGAFEEDNAISNNDSVDSIRAKRGITEIINESDVVSDHHNHTNGNEDGIANGNNNNEEEEEDEGEDEEKYISLITATIEVLKNVDFDLIVLGFATYCFVVGAVSMWAIPFLRQSPLKMKSSMAALLMGGAIIFSGTMGTILGGIALDWMTKEKDIPDTQPAPLSPADDPSALQENAQDETLHTETADEAAATATTTALSEREKERRTELAHWEGSVKGQLFDVAMVVIAIPTGIAALMITKIYIFIIAFFVSVAAVYALTAPINAAILTVVRPKLRPHAVSYSVLFIHLLGDFPSPTLAGYFSDRFGKHCNSMKKEECMQSASSHCRWMESVTTEQSVKDSANGTCESEYQIRNSLVLVFLVLIIAIPC